FFFRSFKSNLAQTVAQRLISGGEDPAAFGGRIVNVFAHSNGLSALSRKYECHFTHDMKFPFPIAQAYQTSTEAPQVKPPPKPTRTMQSPSRSLPASSASASATGMEAADILPYLSRLIIHLSSLRFSFSS